MSEQDDKVGGHKHAFTALMPGWIACHKCGQSWDEQDGELNPICFVWGEKS